MGLLSRRRDRQTALGLEDGGEPEIKFWRVQPSYIIVGPEVVTDEQRCIELDLSTIPSGVTSIQLHSGSHYINFPFDVDGYRFRNPDATSVRFQTTFGS